jgi:hypothetical protein
MIAVDRIEGQIAILDVMGETVEIPVSMLPPDTNEGDVLTLTRVENGKDMLDRENKARLERLRSRDPGDMEIDL